MEKTLKEQLSEIKDRFKLNEEPYETVIIPKKESDLVIKKYLIPAYKIISEWEGMDYQGGSAINVSISKLIEQIDFYSK